MGEGHARLMHGGERGPDALCRVELCDDRPAHAELAESERPFLEFLDIAARGQHQNRLGLERFLEDWIKHTGNSEKLLSARGSDGETLLQNKLARRDVVERFQPVEVLRELAALYRRDQGLPRK